MGEVFVKHECAAGAKYDMVGLKFGPQRFLLYYHTAFEIALGLMTAAKLAARYEGVDPASWVNIAKVQQQEALEPMSRIYRRSQARSNITKWTVGGERNLVVLTFDAETIKIHYSDAFTLYSMIRTAAKNAKRWSGDKGRQWTTHAVLRNAEENDKFVYV